MQSPLTWCKNCSTKFFFAKNPSFLYDSLKYMSPKNVVIHSENCKVEIPLDIHVTAQQLSKQNCRMTGIYEASKKCGFTDLLD